MKAFKYNDPIFFQTRKNQLQPKKLQPLSQWNT